MLIQYQVGLAAGDMTPDEFLCRGVILDRHPVGFEQQLQRVPYGLSSSTTQMIGSLSLTTRTSRRLPNDPK